MSRQIFLCLILSSALYLNSPSSFGIETTLYNGYGNGSVEVTVSPFGNFGTKAGGSANYDPAGPVEAGSTVFKSAVYFSPFGFLHSGGVAGPTLSVSSVKFASSNLVISEFTVSGYTIRLTQELSPVTPLLNGSTLTQTYEVTNSTGKTQSFSMIRYMDGDLSYDGSMMDMAGVINQGSLLIAYQVDEKDYSLITSLGITAEGSGNPSGYRIENSSGGTFVDEVLESGAGILTNSIYEDTDLDKFTDVAYDAVLAMGRSYTLAPGAKAVFRTKTIWGAGTPVTYPGTGPFLWISKYFEEIPSAGGTTTFDILNRGTGTLSWTANSNPTTTPWLRIDNLYSLSGINAKTLTVSYDINPYKYAREGDIYVGSQYFKIRQEANQEPVIYGIPDRITDEDKPIDIFFTVEDPETHSAYLILTASSSNKTLVPDNNVSFNYEGSNRWKATIQPAANQFGNTLIKIYANDLTYIAQTSFNLTVKAVNDPPVALDHSLYMENNDPVEIALTATDVEGDSLSFHVVTPPENGTLSVITGRKITYTPNEGYHGTDKFTFIAKDGKADSNAATIYIKRPPVVFDQSVYVDRDTPVEISLFRDAEGDSLTFLVATYPANGTLSGITTDGKITYTPEKGYRGFDKFTFYADDGTRQSNVATIYIRRAPVAFDQSVYVENGVFVEIILRAVNAAGDKLNYEIIDPPEKGTLSGITDRRITYTPDPGCREPDKFTFRANDGAVYSNTATIYIKHPPVAFDGWVYVEEGPSVEISLRAENAEGDILTFEILDFPAHGTLSTITAEGKITYTPYAGYRGPDKFSFRASDGVVYSNVAAIYINQPVPDLKHAIQALKIHIRIPLDSGGYQSVDINGDGKIGLEEAIYVLREVSGE